MSTENFPIGARVIVVNPPEWIQDTKGLQGVVTARDPYLVQVRMDTITEQMSGFEDGQTGVISFLPDQIIKNVNPSGQAGIGWSL